MPTAQSFVQAAQLFEDVALQAHRLLAPVQTTMGPGVLVGGTISTSTESVVRERAADSGALANELTRLAKECRLRAAVVVAAAAEAAAYDEAFSSYTTRREDFDRRRLRHRDDPTFAHPGQAPRPPSAPSAPPTWARF